MSKQTAVQWLHYHLLHLMQTREWRSKDLHMEKFDELFIEALAMEREQIEKAFDVGLDTGSETPPSIYNFQSDEPSEYYNQTYKGDEQ